MVSFLFFIGTEKNTIFVNICILLGDFDLDELLPDKVIVKMEDFMKASKKFIPSISKKDLEYFNQLKDTYNNV